MKRRYSNKENTAAAVNNFSLGWLPSGLVASWQLRRHNVNKNFCVTRRHIFLTFWSQPEVLDRPWPSLKKVNLNHNVLFVSRWLRLPHCQASELIPESIMSAANTLCHTHKHTLIFVCTYASKKPSNKAKSALLCQQEVLVIFQIQQAGAHLVLPPDRRKALLPALSLDDVLRAISI